MDDDGLHSTPLAIVGMGCRLPGANDLSQFWELLRTQGSGIGELPAERLDRGRYYQASRAVPGKSYTTLGGIVPHTPPGFAANPEFAELTRHCDPAHAVMLDVATEAIRDARLSATDLRGVNAGVFVGHARGHPLGGDLSFSTHVEELVLELCKSERFARLPQSVREATSRGVIDNVHRAMPRRLAGGGPDTACSGAAAIINRAYDLTGPYLTADAACASSLVALQLAARALEQKRIDLAIVGGASYSSWFSLILFSQAQALSAIGSFPFDARADGFISSDGYAALVVKTLTAAIADGDRIWGVVRGIGMSSDGKGKSLWAPRKEGQIEAIRRAHRGLQNPFDLQYVEAHGTSTQVGDATEVAALCEAFRDRLPRNARIPISSVKANIGHTRETAGLAGLIKTLLCMHHQVIPAATSFETPNPQIPWDRIPFFVPTREIPWQRAAASSPRRAAIDAFGIGGLNVHVVVEDFVRETDCTLPQSNPGTSGTVNGRPSPHSNGASGAGDSKSRRQTQPLATTKSNDDGAVAIVGLGAVFPGARDCASFWELLQSGRDPRTDVAAARWNPDLFLHVGEAAPWRSPTTLGGFVTDFTYDWRKHRIPPRQLETADPLQFMLLDAVQQALSDSGYDQRPFDRRRTAVVVGSMFGGDFIGQLNTALRLPEFNRYLRAQLRAHGVSPEDCDEIYATFAREYFAGCSAVHDETGSYTSSTLSSRIAKTLDVMGGAFTIDADGTSSLSAVGAAVSLLLSNDCDAVLCAAGQRAMDIAVFEQYAARGVLSQDPARGGFDAAASGIVPGEGAGAVMLKRLRDAQRDEDRVLAVIRGIGAGMCVDSPGRSLRLAIGRAAGTSATPPVELVAIEAAGLGIPEWDAAEADAVADSYRAQPSEMRLLIGTVAGQIGYSQGASGMASLIKLVLSFQHGKLPASFGFVEPAECLSASGGRLTGLAAPMSFDRLRKPGPPRGAVNALSLRGQAWHLVLESVPSQKPVSPQAVRPLVCIRMGAASLSQLQEVLVQNRENAAALFAGAPLARFATQPRASLAIVCDDVESLQRKWMLAERHLSGEVGRSVLEDQGVFCVERGERRPRVAVLFPGQGSQYGGMLRELIDESPAAAAMRKTIDAVLTRLGHAGFEEIVAAGKEGLGQDVWRTQLAVLLADLIVYAALEDQGVTPDVVAGHSFGEFPALVAAGVWTLEQAVRLTKSRCDAIERQTTVSGGMLATDAPLVYLEPLIESLAGGVFFANYNAPDQTVLAGTQNGLSEVERQLATMGYQSQRLPVPRPFHTPLMAPVVPLWSDVLAGERLLPPRVPVLSSVTNRYVADPADIRENLISQLTSPVRYVDLVRRLADDGVTIFIEAGPRQVLTRLNRRIFEGTNVSLVACDNPKRPGAGQLQHVVACLDCAGAAPRNLDRPDRVAVGLTHASPVDVNQSVAMGPIVHFDATARRREKKRRNAEIPQESATARPSESREQADELQTFLINFVCEQTGYPAEIVALDADLEADLGLDSIKKARLFGELREHFSIRPVENLSLSDFPTLRHVLDFLRQSDRVTPGGSDSDPLRTADKPLAAPSIREISAGNSEPVPVFQKVGAPVPPVSDIETLLNVTRLTGSPYEMGWQHATAHSESIKLVLNRYGDLVETNLSGISELYDALADPTQYLDSAGYDELRGMSDALNIPMDYLMAYNLGLYPDAVPGCVQFAIAARHNGSEGLLHAMNEDWVLALALPDCLKRILQVRHPADGLPHIIFGAAGQLAGMNGINASGLAVSGSLLLDRPRPDHGAAGKMHSIVIRQVLQSAADIDSAIDVIRRFERIGAWGVCLSHHLTDEICYLEYDGKSLLTERRMNDVAVTNHCRLHKPRVDVPDHSRWRHRRLAELLQRKQASGYTLQEAQATLRDRYDPGRERVTPHLTMNTIQRVDNQASIVLRPAQQEAWVTAGPLAGNDVDRFALVRVDELLAPLARPVGPNCPVQAPMPGLAPLRDAPETTPEPETSAIERFILRMIDVPLETPAGQQVRLAGPVLLLGDNPTAAAFRERLRQDGVEALDLPVHENPDETLAELDRLWSTCPSPHLVLMTGRDVAAAQANVLSGWTQRMACGVELPFLVCQKWIQLAAEAEVLPRASLTAVTALGGDCGFSGNIAAPEGGGLSGLLKAVRQEFPALRVKSIDAPWDETPAKIAESVYREMIAGSRVAEVGYLRGQRRIVSAVPRASVPREDRRIRHGGVWVITGGARGITAIVARELGRRYGLKLHLIGSSPAPDIDPEWRSYSLPQMKQLKMSVALEARKTGRNLSAAWNAVERAIEIDRNLRALVAAGVQAVYHACDVSNRDELARVLDTVRRDGPIQGIVHGAGYEAASRFDRKSRENFQTTLGSKVAGASAMMELTRADPLEVFVAFGSVSGRFGGTGQTDYSMASDLLAKLVGAFRSARPECTAFTVHWPAWDEVGMAVRPESKFVIAGAGQRFLPPAEGVDRLIAEIEAGAPESEVLITSSTSRLDRDGILPGPASIREHHLRRDVIAASPLIDGLRELVPQERLIAEVRLDPARDPFLRDHRLNGTAILPLVIGMEMFAEAAKVFDPNATPRILHTVRVVNGLKFHLDRPQQATIHLARAGDELLCELRSDFCNRDGRLTDPQRLYLSAVLQFTDESPPTIPMEPDSELQWNPMRYWELGEALSRGRVYLGPPFRCLREIAIKPQTCWGRIVTPADSELLGSRPLGSRIGDPVFIPGAVLDACYHAAGAYLFLVHETVQVPQSLERIRRGRRPRAGEVCVVHARLLEITSTWADFDIDLYGDDWSVIVAMERFRFSVFPQKGK